jgi:hypothetical protein
MINGRPIFKSTFLRCRARTQKNKQRQAEGTEVAKKSGVRFERRKYEINEKFIQVYGEWKSGVIEELTEYRN